VRQIELVVWRDSVSLGGWQHLNDMTGWAGREITTVGLVVSETSDDLVLAMSSGNAGSGEVLCNWTSIPKECIKYRAALGEKP